MGAVQSLARGLRNLDDKDVETLYDLISKENKYRDTRSWLDRKVIPFLKSSPFMPFHPVAVQRYSSAIEYNNIELAEEYNINFQTVDLPVRLYMPMYGKKERSKTSIGARILEVDMSRIQEWLRDVPYIASMFNGDEEFTLDGDFDEHGYGTGHIWLSIMYHPHPFPIDLTGEKVPQHVVAFCNKDRVGEIVTPARANEIWAEKQNEDKSSEPASQNEEEGEKERILKTRILPELSLIPIW